ncbi:MAG: hypothetical protein QGG53_03510 [Planctomycetota bacterium]|nr:hypothetical protein [Planctomycetota bacterium]
MAISGPMKAGPEIEFLGVIERQARLRGTAISPGTDRYPPRFIAGFDTDGTWIVNLSDGSSRKVIAPGFEEEHIGWPCFIGSDGKIFCASFKGGLAVYDPVTDAMKLVRPIPKARWLRGMAIGPDGGVYVSDYPTGSAARYDPKTGEITNYGPQGGPFNIKNIYGYSVGFDGRWVYTASGKMPWFVVAYDTDTGKQKNILTFASSNHPEVHQRKAQVFLAVKFGGDDAARPPAIYRLKDGKALPAEALPKFDDSYIPGNQQRPRLDGLGRSLALVEGGAEFRYRLAGQKQWKRTVIPVKGVDMRVERITPTKNNKLLVSTGPYGNVHSFDPETGKTTQIGAPASKNVYDMLEHDGRIYFCGYPNAIFGVIEKSEGKILGNWHQFVGAKHSMFLVKGADGRIYSGNHAEREFVGGSLGWYAPEDGKFGGVRFPNDDCQSLLSAMEGKLIVYSSEFSHDPLHPEIKQRKGQLIVYSTETQKIVRKAAPVSDPSAGVIIEVKPGIVLGLSQHDKRPVMYKVDITTGKVFGITRIDATARKQAVLGPDSKVYVFIAEHLCRIDPDSMQVKRLCKAAPGRLAFVGNDLYLAGHVELRRLPDAVKE